MVAKNEFITTGPGGTMIPTPAFSGGKYAPGIRKMAKEFAEEAGQFGMSMLGQKGMTDSSFAPVLMERAYRHAIPTALNVWQGESQKYNQWARDYMAMNAAMGADQQEPSFLQQMLTGGITGVGLGAAFTPKGSDNPWLGPLIGLGAGAALPVAGKVLSGVGKLFG